MVVDKKRDAQYSAPAAPPSPQLPVSGKNIRVGIASGMQAAGKAIAPIKTAGAMADGAAVGAAATGIGALKDPGAILAVLGLLTFFSDFLQSTPLFLIIETGLLFYTTVALFQWRGFVFVTLFYIWYNILGGSTDPQSLLRVAPTLLVTGMILRAIIGRAFLKEGFSEGFKSEVVGIVPVTIFFLEVGLVEFLTKQFHFTLNSFLENVLLFTPWWALFGLFATKKEHFFISLAKFFGVVYIISILTIGIAPEAIDTYRSSAPGPGELLRAKNEFKDQAAPRINPFLAFIDRMGCSFSDPVNAQECIQKKEEEAQIKVICEEKQGLSPGTPVYDGCVKEQREKKRNPSQQVFGVVDPTIKQPTTVKLTVDQKSFPGYSDERLPFPAEVELENPRRQNITFEVTCSFDGKEGAADVSGSIQGRAQAVRFNDLHLKETFLCAPQEKLEGNYILEFNLTLKDLTTISRLQRVFIGDKPTEEKERLLREEIPVTVHLAESQAPQDLARLSFDLGHAAKEIVIENKDYRTLILRSKIENLGRGQLISVHKYFIDLPGFSAENGGGGEESGVGMVFGCMQGSIPVVGEPREDIPLPACIIADYPAELKNPPDWTLKEFRAEVQYDYRITATAPVQIKNSLRVE